MCESGKTHNNIFRPRNQAMVLNASDLENQTDSNENSNKSYNVVKRNPANNKSKRVLTRETSMTYIFSQDFVTDISKSFKEKKFVQKVLPTKFSKEFLGTNVDDLSTPSTLENDGRYHEIYYYNLPISHT
jgi:hypothetical protein